MRFVVNYYYQKRGSDIELDSSSSFRISNLEFCTKQKNMKLSKSVRVLALSLALALGGGVELELDIHVQEGV